MQVESVEMFARGLAGTILRLNGRAQPDVLVGGQALWSLCEQADRACADRGSLTPAASAAINDLRNALWSYLTHYKAVLAEHDMGLPFSEFPLRR